MTTPAKIFLLAVAAALIGAALWRLCTGSPNPGGLCFVAALVIAILLWVFPKKQVVPDQTVGHRWP